MENQQILFGERGPIQTLLISLSTLFLDPYVLDVITDPAIRTKLLISKLGKSSQRAVRVKTLRRARNSFEHGTNISPQEEEKYYQSIIEVRNWISSEVFTQQQLIMEQKISLQCCDRIMETFNPEPKMVIETCLPISSANVSLPILPTEIPKISYLKDLKVTHREAVKGKHFLVLDGRFKDMIGRFSKWNGSNCIIVLGNGQRIYPMLSSQVQLINL
jgi:hypothetical protein